MRSVVRNGEMIMPIQIGDDIHHTLGNGGWF
jgi:hypothetical protein